MDAKEFEEQLGDLETRVDRLRALYENWFRGYEKQEPSVARKDVERRVYGLRKELPRNTALRFRYHQLYQRYTTLGTYWSRTAKQIEEGTYRLQLQRFRRKKDKQHDREEASQSGEQRDKKERPTSFELDENESLSVDDLLSDFEKDELASAWDAPAAKQHDDEPPTGTVRAVFGKPKRKPSTRPPAAVVPMMKESRGSTPPPGQGTRPRPGFQEDEVDVPTGLHLSLDDEGPRAKPARPGAVKLSPLPARPGGAPERHPLAPKAPAGAGNPARPALPEAELGRASSPGAPGAQAGSSPTGTSPGVPRTSLGGAVPPAAPAGRESGPGSPRAPLAGGPAAPAPRAPGASAPGQGLPRPSLPGVPPPPPRASAPGAAPPAPAASANGARPAPAAPAASGARPGPPPPPRPGAAPSAPTGTAPAARNNTPITSGNTIVGHPAPRSPLAGAQKESAGGSIADQRMRRIYHEYVEARRRNNEGEVRYESLVSSIERMMPDLQKKHAGKQIDFEVVLKDGRVGLKPKAT